MTQHTTGNLIDLAEAGKFDVIVHGCNCFNTMGGGIAREIRSRYSDASRVDSQTVRGDYNKLGTFTKVDVANKGKHFTIVNAYTQYKISTGEDVFEYTAFQLVLEKLAYLYGDRRIGLPYIGMGLAGGDRDLILAMIDGFSDGIAERGGSVTLVQFK
jgi:O-acetyl-ADP-ribose deacetylase (regulator of RNase III)